MANKQIDIHSMFFPSQHIVEPKWFAGRLSDIEQALKSLCTPGGSMVVFGERGAGKTSFVEMVKLLATGDSYLLYKHNLQRFYQPEKFKFKIVSFSCNHETTSVAKVLQNLITSPEGFKSLVSSRIDKIESVNRDKLGLDILKIFKFGSEEENRTIYSEFKEENVFETFTNLVQTIQKNVLNHDEGLLIVIDEFDLVKDSSKMASLIKNLSKDKVKFLIAGIAESFDSLIDGHESIMRQLVYGRIKIKLMNNNEVHEVFNLVEDSCKKSVRFDEVFKSSVLEKSSGFPYFVQLFGQLALEEAIKESSNDSLQIVNVKHLKDGIKKLGYFEHQMEDDYLSIIKDNPIKELMIKYLAKQISTKINDEDVFSYMYSKDVRQPIPKNILASLLAHRDPQFLIREREDSNYVKFTNSLFKAFINSRDPELLKYNKKGEFISPTIKR